MLIMCVSVFAGCSLVGRNDKNYYEATVATISYVDGTTENINKRDLITAFNSYGYNYVQNYNYTTKQAVEQTLETVINRRITIKAVENYYKNLGEDLLLGNETTYLYDETYNAIYSNVKSYLEGVSTSDENSTEETDKSVFNDYKSKVYLDEDLVIRKKSPATTIRATYEERKKDDVAYNIEYKSSENKYIFKEMMYQTLIELKESNDSSAKAWKNAFNKYVSDVKKNYSYKTFESDKECILFEIDRVYEILKENYIVEKYETIYNAQKQQDADISNITVDDVLRNYSAKVRADYATYVVEGNSSSYESSILSDVGNVDYILEGNGNSNYFYVGYVKAEFSESQKSDLAKWKTQLDNRTITPSRYASLVEGLYNENNVMVTVRNEKDGSVTGEKSAKELLSLINSDVTKFKYNDNESAELNKNIGYKKAEAFRKYLYSYNDDDTLKGADYNAVFGVTTDNKVLAGEKFTNNDDAKEAILALYNDGNAKVGDTTGLVKAEDGYYIFFYAGKIENPIAVDGVNFDASKQKNNIKVLTSTRLNIFSNKTVFDSIYDSLAQDNFAVFQNMNINYLRKSLTTKIEGVENNIKDMY